MNSKNGMSLTLNRQIFNLILNKMILLTSGCYGFETVGLSFPLLYVCCKLVAQD